jgi:hypothetical protein
MKQLARKLFLTGFLFIGIALSSYAQNKYEYAVIEFTPAYRILHISINGVEFKKTFVPKEKIKDNTDVNAALEEISGMQENGWEAINFSTNSQPNVTCYNFFLKRKK